MMMWENMDYFQKLMCMVALKKVNKKVNFFKILLYIKLYRSIYG